jgi:Fic family protein
MDNLLTEIELLLNKYNSLHIPQAIDWEKYNHYSIVHHSTSIEGSSLTEEETQLLLDENITAKGKPLEHHHMQKDHYNALLFILDAAKNKKMTSVNFLKEVAGLVMKNTGGIHNTALGSFDSGKGDFRLLNVHAGSTRFVDFSKVPDLVDKFCKELNDKLVSINDHNDALITSFDAHFNLVSIHPFADGNGRVSRLVMNFIQHYYQLPLSNVFKEDKAEYYRALIDTRTTENMDVFRTFMLNQYKKMLDLEIQKVLDSQNEHLIKKDNKSGMGMSMIF